MNKFTQSQFIPAVQILLLLLLTSSPFVFIQGADSTDQETDSEFELFLWFSELEPEEAETLANKDPEELDKDLELTQKLLTDKSVNQTIPDSSDSTPKSAPSTFDNED